MVFSSVVRKIKLTVPMGGEVKSKYVHCDTLLLCAVPRSAVYMWSGSGPCGRQCEVILLTLVAFPLTFSAEVRKELSSRLKILLEANFLYPEQ